MTQRLTGTDTEATKRQAGIVGMSSNAATFTGSGCFPWAGGRIGPAVAAQGNILVGEATLLALVDTFRAEQDTLAVRLIRSRAVADAAGGDSRGKQSAAMLVVNRRPAMPASTAATSTSGSTTSWTRCRS